jgi:hypothetical protein
MTRRLGLNSALLVAAVAVGCGGTGPAGPAGTKGEPGAKGDQGDEGPASVSAVTPTAAFLARTLDVTISGNGTTWSDKTKVDFGAKITVNKTTAASATALVANITVGPDAATGPRDVTVTDDAGKMEVFKGAFELSSPLKVTTGGTLAQGSLIAVHARGLDFETPFDTTSTGDGFFSPLVFTNVDIPATAGINNQVGNVSDYAVDYTMIVDVMTAAGPQDVDIKSGPPGDVVEFPMTAAVTIAARTPTPLSTTTAANAMITNPGDSALFTYTPSAATLRIIDFTAAATDMNATPTVYFLPKTGKFSDLLGAGAGLTIAPGTTDPFYAIFTDGGGYSGYTGTLAVKETPATGGAEKEPNNTQANATTNGPLALPFVVQGATLSSDTDEDWFAVTVTAADVAAGKVIHVQTIAGDPLTDTVVDILDSMGNSSLGGPSDDQVYLDEFTSDPVTKAGTYFVQITASSVFDPTHNKYDVVIRLE